MLGLGLFAFYVAIQRGAIASYDGKVMLDVARSIVDRHALTTTHDALGFNTPYASYGIGMSLVMVPLYAMQRGLGVAPDVLVTLANPLILATCGVVLFRLARALDLRPGQAVAAALAFGLLTMAPNMSTEVFSEPAVALGCLLAVLGAVRWRQGRAHGPWLMGGGVAAAALFRTDSLVLVGVVLLALPLFLPRPRLVDRRALLGVVIPIAAAAAWIAWYDRLRYGSVLRIGYPGQGFTAPFFQGLAGLVASPGKGFWWFNPVLVLAVPGLIVLWRRDRAVTAAIVALVIARPLFYARWSSWVGGVVWGPRFLFPWCALLAIPAVLSFELVDATTAAARLLKFGAVILAAASAAVVVASVWVPYEQWWNRITAPRLGYTVTHRNSHDYVWTFAESHLAGNVRLLTRASPFPLRHFGGGVTVVGALGTAAAAACLAIAVALSYGWGWSVYGG